MYPTLIRDEINKLKTRLIKSRNHLAGLRQTRSNIINANSIDAELMRWNEEDIHNESERFNRIAGGISSLEILQSKAGRRQS